MVTRQGIRKRAKLEQEDPSVLIAWWSCAFQQIARVCGHNAGGSDICKVYISSLISAHLAWWSSTAQRIAWVCGHNAEGSELFPFASQYF